MAAEPELQQPLKAHRSAAAMCRLFTLLVGCVVWLGAHAPSLAQAPTGAVVVRDDRGTEHRFATPPTRIVSLLPSLTEAVAALGAADRLVGVDRYSNWPPQVQRLPQLGGLDETPLEAVLALQPDLVLASSSARSLDRLEALGLRVLRLKSDSHADVQRSLLLLGQLLGQPQLGAQRWAQMQAQLAQAAQRVPAAWRGQRVYFEVGAGPYAAGATSFIGQTLALMGLATITTPEQGPFPKLNPEFVVLAQPDLIIVLNKERAAMAQRPGWRALKALQRLRVCGLTESDYELLIRPGPRLGDAAAVVADCLVQLPAQP
jgi:iron complex transport system substrate-binding protein